MQCDVMCPRVGWLVGWLKKCIVSSVVPVQVGFAQSRPWNESICFVCVCVGLSVGVCLTADSMLLVRVRVRVRVRAWARVHDMLSIRMIIYISLYYRSMIVNNNTVIGIKATGSWTRTHKMWLRFVCVCVLCWLALTRKLCSVFWFVLYCSVLRVPYRTVLWLRISN